MNHKFFIFLIILQLLACKSKAPDTTTVGLPGTYIKKYDNGEIGGKLMVYPYSSNTFFIHLEVNRGAPSYNSGRLTTMMKWSEDGASFEESEDGMDCRLQFHQEEDRIIINTISRYCGFGYGVYADGTYYRESGEVPEYFVNGEGSKIYFADFMPEEGNE